MVGSANDTPTPCGDRRCMSENDMMGERAAANGDTEGLTAPLPTASVGAPTSSATLATTASASGTSCSICAMRMSGGTLSARARARDRESSPSLIVLAVRHEGWCRVSWRRMRRAWQG